METLHTALYDAFREAGTSEEKARAAATGFPPPEQIATKADIARLEIKIAQLEIKIAQLETKMEIKIAQLQTKMENKIAQLETKISVMKEELTVRIMWAQGVTIGVLGVLITTLKLF